MDSKELVQQGYDLFAKGDMEGFMNLVHDDFTFIYPGDKHPFSGTHNKAVSYTHLRAHET